MASDVILETVGLTKEFGGFVAVKDVNLRVRRGTIHALIGPNGAGKTTLFQLMTSAREAPRTHGKAEAHVGMSLVPDERLDRLTALFQPKRRVPATVEFADMAAARSETKALLDVAAYRNADALLHVVRAFRDPAVAHANGSVNPARDVQLIEDELVLADLGVTERRLERLEANIKKASKAEDVADKVQRYLRQVLVEKVVETEVAAKVAPTDLDLTTYFKAHSEDYRLPDKLRLRGMRVPAKAVSPKSSLLIAR